MSPGDDRYLVTALVSTYSSARFMKGLLDDLLQQTIADRLEIIVCDSASPESEGEIVDHYISRHPNISYLRTGERENSHVSFNRCIQLARGKYLTTACTDDRRRPDALELMVRALEDNPDIGLVYADSLITRGENETFADNSATSQYHWPDYTLAMALSTCPFGSQPLWRRTIHDSIGLFDPELWIAGDHDMFLRIAWQCGAIHLAAPLGLFLQRPDSNSGADNRAEVTEDVLRVLRRFRRESPLEDIYPGLTHTEDTAARSAALTDMGNLCALSPYNDYGMAMQFYDEAKDCKGSLTREDAARYANNAACIFACAGMTKEARRLLERAPLTPEGMTNLRVLREMEGSGRAAQAAEFAFAEDRHPVVLASRQSRGLLLGADGELVWSPHQELRPWDVYQVIRDDPVRGEQVAQPSAS